MQKQGKQFIALCVTFLLCGAVFLGLKWYNQKTADDEEAKNAEETITVTSFDSDEVTGLTYLYEGETLAFEKKEDTWYYQGDNTISLNQDTISSMLSSVKNITTKENVIAEGEEDYGLGTPSNVITVQLADKKFVLNVGMKNEVTNQVYLKANQEETIYLVNSSTFSDFNKNLDDLKAEEESDS